MGNISQTIDNMLTLKIGFVVVIMTVLHAQQMAAYQLASDFETLDNELIDLFEIAFSKNKSKASAKKVIKKEVMVASNSSYVKSVVGNAINKRLVLWNKNGSEVIKQKLKDKAIELIKNYQKKYPKKNIKPLLNETKSLILKIHSSFTQKYISKNVTIAKKLEVFYLNYIAKKEGKSMPKSHMAKHIKNINSMFDGKSGKQLSIHSQLALKEFVTEFNKLLS